jgi:hypothetical protein
MNIWKKLFGDGSKPSTSANTKTATSAPISTTQPKPNISPAPTPQNIEPTQSTTTPYVESVFAFDLTDKPESYVWRKIDGLCLVPDLVRNKDIAQAEAVIREVLPKYSDYSFVHYWNTIVFEKKGDIDKARQSCAEGIRVSNEKHYLCGQLAMLEFKHGTLKEAVRWWIRSILLQMPNKSVDDAQSFLYLAFIALLNHQNDASSMLMAASAKGRHGAVDLSHEGKQDVSRKVNAEPYDEVRLAIQELTTRRWTGF